MNPLGAHVQRKNPRIERIIIMVITACSTRQSLQAERVSYRQTCIGLRQQNRRHLIYEPGLLRVEDAAISSFTGHFSQIL